MTRPPASPAEHTAKGAPTLTLGALLRQFIPLSFSDLVMVLAGPIIIAGLTRLPDQQVHLAAYSVAEAMAILIESPIIMLLHASTTLSRDRKAFQTLQRFMIWANLTLTVVFGLVAFTPLYDVLFQGWLRQPAAVASAARPAFAVMLLWPAAIGWRRFYQGLLIVQKRSGLVGLASIARLVSLTLVVIAGVHLRLPGGLVAGLALVSSVIVEAAAVTFFALRELKRYTWAEPVEQNPRTLRAVAAWYLPLAVTSALVWVSKPAINGGIARTAGSALSLAAWPAAWTTMMLIANAIRMVQQMVITQATTPANHRVLMRFSLGAGIAASGLMAVIGLSPAGGVLLTQVTGLQGDLAAVAVPALRLGILFPLGVALQNHLQGLLIRHGRTRAVNLAALVGSAALFLMMVAGVYLGWLGTVVGAAAAVAGQAAEVVVLFFMTAPERADLSPPGESA